MSISKVSFFILKTLQYCFLLAILSEHRSENVYIFSILFAIGFLLVSYNSLVIKPLDLKWQDVFSLGWISIGAMATYFVTINTNFGVVLSAAIIGSLGACIPNRSVFKDANVAIYCGVFVGMTSPFFANGYANIFYASILTGLLFIASKNQLEGFGGKLGTIAFGGVALLSLYMYINSIL